MLLWGIAVNESDFTRPDEDRGFMTLSKFSYSNLGELRNLKVTLYQNLWATEVSKGYLIFKVWVDEGSLFTLPSGGVLLLLHLRQNL